MAHQEAGGIGLLPIGAAIGQRIQLDRPDDPGQQVTADGIPDRVGDGEPRHQQHQ